MTINCVRCGKKAKFRGGHVLKGKSLTKSTKIIAGWCSKRCFEAPGFMGHWMPFMGEEKP